MSDNYILICTAKEVDNPEEKADKVLKWLQDKMIVEKEQTNCVLGINDLGYKPSKKYKSVIEYDEDVLRFVTCGLEIKTKREVLMELHFLR